MWQDLPSAVVPPQDAAHALNISGDRRTVLGGVGPRRGLTLKAIESTSDLLRLGVFEHLSPRTEFDPRASFCHGLHRLASDPHLTGDRQ